MVQVQSAHVSSPSGALDIMIKPNVPYVQQRRHLIFQPCSSRKKGHLLPKYTAKKMVSAIKSMRITENATIFTCKKKMVEAHLEGHLSSDMSNDQPLVKSTNRMDHGRKFNLFSDKPFGAASFFSFFGPLAVTTRHRSVRLEPEKLLFRLWSPFLPAKLKSTIPIPQF
jgi:hypothetical protein